jgi:NAD(P)-dependent dehydrogenase (short-subunit alcohol dehydrogenase family)
MAAWSEPNVPHRKETIIAIRICVMKQVIVITGASSGFGRSPPARWPKAGHTVYASMRDTAGRNAAQVAESRAMPPSTGRSAHRRTRRRCRRPSADAGDRQIVAEQGRLDVVVHNAGHMSFGPAEAFTPEQFAELYDINVLDPARQPRGAAATAQAGQGLLVWVSSSSARGGTPPYLAPYFAAKAAMDSMAVTYAGELARWGIETSIIVPGAFTKGTNHFAHSGAPADKARAAEYEAGPYAGFASRRSRASPRSSRRTPMPPRSPMRSSRVVDTPFGKRPFRVHVDPVQDGAEIVNGVADRRGHPEGQDGRLILQLRSD